MFRLYVYPEHGERYEHMGTYIRRKFAENALKRCRRAFLTDDTLRKRECPIAEVGCKELRKALEAVKDIL